MYDCFTTYVSDVSKDDDFTKRPHNFLQTINLDLFKCNRHEENKFQVVTNMY